MPMRGIGPSEGQRGDDSITAPANGGWAGSVALVAGCGDGGLAGVARQADTAVDTDLLERCCEWACPLDSHPQPDILNGLTRVVVRLVTRRRQQAYARRTKEWSQCGNHWTYGVNAGGTDRRLPESRTTWTPFARPWAITPAETGWR